VERCFGASRVARLSAFQESNALFEFADAQGVERVADRRRHVPQRLDLIGRVRLCILLIAADERADQFAAYNHRKR
jgi:hypothetical protein